MFEAARKTISKSARKRLRHRFASVSQADCGRTALLGILLLILLISEAGRC